MVLILIMLFIAAANVAGCVLIRKRGIQIFLGITAWAWVLIALASGPASLQHQLQNNRYRRIGISRWHP